MPYKEFLVSLVSMASIPSCPDRLCQRPCVLSHFSHVQLFVTPWTVAHQAPLSMGFPRQEYWSGLPFPMPEDLPNPGIQSASLALTGGIFTTRTAWGHIINCSNAREIVVDDSLVTIVKITRNGPSYLVRVCFKEVFFFWSIVAFQDYITFRCTTQ